MAQFYDSSSSPFYRSRYPTLPVLDKGNLGPPIYGPYQQRWDAYTRQWYRPDGSRAQLSGLGDMVLPELDVESVSARSGAPEVINQQTFVTIAVALGLGLGGGWALQKHHKLIGFTMLGLGGFAAVTALLMLKKNMDARAGYYAYTGEPAPPPPGVPNSGMLAGSRVWGVPPNLLRGSKSW